MSKPVIATRLVAAFGVLLSFTSLQAQPPGPPAGGPDPASLPTPRLPNGKPDLTGSWQQAGGGQRGVAGGMFRRCSPFQSNCMEWTNQSSDFVFMAPSRLDPNHPLYKPEYWDKVQQLDMWTNRDDPVMTCLPLGIPPAGRACANLRHRQRHHDGLSRRTRRRRRLHGAANGPRRMAASTTRSARSSTRIRATRSAAGKATRSCSIRSASHRRNVARSRRLVPLRPDARRGEVHAQGQPDALRGDGRGSGSVREAVGHESADTADLGQPRDDRGARQLRGRRARRSQHSDPTLAIRAGGPRAYHASNAIRAGRFLNEAGGRCPLAAP